MTPKPNQRPVASGETKKGAGLKPGLYEAGQDVPAAARHQS